MTLLDPHQSVSIDESFYFDNLAHFEETHWWSRSMWRIASAWLLEFSKGRSGLAALDVGCGSGLTTARLAACEQIETIVGLDPSAAGLEWSRRRHGLPLARASATNIPLDDSSVDVVICFDVLQHLAPGEDTLAVMEIARLLRPGGLAIVRTCARRIIPPKLPVQGRSYRRACLERLTEKAGLWVRRISYANMAPALFDEYRAWRANRSGASFKHALSSAKPGSNSRVVCALASCEAFALVSLGLGLPWGHSLVCIAQKP